MYAQFLINLLTFLCLVSFEDPKQFMVNGRPTVINADQHARRAKQRNQVEVTPLAADSELDTGVSQPASQSAATAEGQCKEDSDKCLVGFEQKLLSYQDPQTTTVEKIGMVIPMCQ